MVTIEIKWDDLTPEKQKEIQKTLNLASDDNGNWDVIPLAILEFDEEAWGINETG